MLWMLPFVATVLFIVMIKVFSHLMKVNKEDMWPLYCLIVSGILCIVSASLSSAVASCLLKINKYETRYEDLSARAAYYDMHEELYPDSLVEDIVKWNRDITKTREYEESSSFYRTFIPVVDEELDIIPAEGIMDMEVTE